MSYEVPQQRRPGSVTAAGYLLFLVAFLIVVDAVIGIATAGAVADATRKAYESAGLPTASQTGTFTQGGTIVGGVIYVLLAAGLAVLGVLDLRGKNPARIVTWVLGGLGVLCFCAGAVGGAVGGSLLSGLPASNGVSAADLTKRIQDAEPSWLQPTQTTLAVINLIALILVIILLALPASNAYFRKPAQAIGGFQPYPPAPYGIQPPPPPPSDEPPYPGPPSP